MTPGAPPFGGAVLCGGASRRMGTDKALLAVGRQPMALRVTIALQMAGAQSVVAVGGDAAALGALGLRVVPDERPGERSIRRAVVAASGLVVEEVHGLDPAHLADADTPDDLAR